MSCGNLFLHLPASAVWSLAVILLLAAIGFSNVMMWLAFRVAERVKPSQAFVERVRRARERQR